MKISINIKCDNAIFWTDNTVFNREELRRIFSEIVKRFDDQGHILNDHSKLYEDNGNYCGKVRVMN